MKKIYVFVALLCLSMFYAKAQYWNVTGGNYSTTPPTDYIGTADGHELVFKVNSTYAGVLEWDPLTANTAFGYTALSSNVGGVFNVAVGYYSLPSNETGKENTAVGGNAMYTNIEGNDNVAIGFNALSLGETVTGNVAIGANSLYNYPGSYQVAVGAGALYNSVDGSQNTSVGTQTLYNTLSGSNNTAIGIQALLTNFSGNRNTAQGALALFKNYKESDNVAVGFNTLYSAAADQNTAIGSEAMYNTTTGGGNTAAGFRSLYHNINGGANAAFGNYSLFTNNSGTANTALGFQALFNNYSGNGNCAVGYSAMNWNWSGNYNTAIGQFSLYNVSSGSGNTALGEDALQGVGIGSNNTALGYKADIGLPATTNTTSIGYQAVNTANNTVLLGNTSVLNVNCFTGTFTISSDKRIKTSIKENVPGLAFINKLRPVTFHYNLKALDEIIIPEKKDSVFSKNDLEARNATEKVQQTGFIAQEVEQAAKELDYDFNGVIAPKNDRTPYSVAYASFVVPLVKSVQELSSANDKKDSIIGALNSKVDQMQTQINQILEKLNGKTESISLSSNSSFLEQNAPNPFNSSTIIRYSVAGKASNPELRITDLEGRLLKSTRLSSKSGQVVVNAGELTAGTYVYNLLVDGVVLDSKKMILTK